MRYVRSSGPDDIDTWFQFTNINLHFHCAKAEFFDHPSGRV